MMNNIILLFLVIFFNYSSCAPIPIGYIGFSDSVSDKLFTLIENYVRKYSSVLSLPSGISHEASDQTLDAVNTTMKEWVDKGVQNIFFYLPELSQGDLQSLAAFYNIYVFNAINAEELNCLSMAVHGYDLCLQKSQTIHRYIMRFKHNIIISEPSDCINGLVKFLTQFGHNNTLFLVKESIVEQDITDHVSELKAKLDLDAKIVVYNFIPKMDIAKHITTELNAAAFTNAVVMNFGIDRYKVIDVGVTTPADYEKNYFVGEMYMIDDTSELYELAEPTPAPSAPPATPSTLSSSQILMYEMIDIVRQKYQENPYLTTIQLESEFFEKNLKCSGGLNFSMFTNNRIVGDIQVVEIDTTTTPASLKLADTVVVSNKLPAGQIIGQPQPVTCNVINDPPLYPQSALHIGLSIYGNNERGVQESHNLAAFLAAIDKVNEGV